MKQILSLILSAMLVLTLCACSLVKRQEEAPAPSVEAPLPPATEAPKKDFDTLIREILAGSSSFFSLENQIYMTLDEYCVSGTGYESIPTAFTKAAALDMDGDGKDEILLWLSGTEDGEHFGTLILSRGKDRVEGQMLVYHDLSRLKADGTFRWYGKHGSAGIAARKGPDWKSLAREEKADYSSSDNAMVYTVDREAFGLDHSLSDEEAYRLANEIQDGKEDVQWTAYPCDDLDLILNPEAVPEASKEIDFRYPYRGFTAIRLEDRESFEAFSEAGLKVIFSEDDWGSYMGQYCPGIPYYEDVDFSTQCLLASVQMGARPTYVQSSRIRSLRSEGGHFVLEYDEGPADCIALNSSETTHFFVEVLIIEKSDLPTQIDELIYHPQN